jgi:hypothetical protein
LSVPHSRTSYRQNVFFISDGSLLKFSSLFSISSEV